MLKSIVILIVGSFIFSTLSFGQTNEISSPPKKKNSSVGFYGKRFIFQFGAGIHHNSFLKWMSNKEKNYRNWYTQLHKSGGSDQINYSFYGSLGIQLKERVAFSVDFSYYFGNMVVEDYGYRPSYSGNPTPGKTARINYETIRIMPRIEIGSRGSNSPTGLTHIIGFGLELSKGKSKKYDAIVSDSNDDYLHYTYGAQKNVDILFTTEAAFNLTFMYGMEYRFPLSKNLALNIGGYFHLNIPQVLLEEMAFFYVPSNSIDHEFKNELSVARTMNFFSIRSGLVLML